jgi:hypothetical protein
LSYAEGTFHRKGMVVDGRMALLFTGNFASVHLQSGIGLLGCGVLVTHPARVRGMQVALSGQEMLAAHAQRDGVYTNIPAAFTALVVERARKRVVVFTGILDPPAAVVAACGWLCARSVQVTVFTTCRMRYPAAELAARDLGDVGVVVRCWVHPKADFHQNVWIVDSGKGCYVGSANLSNRSWYVDQEMMVETPASPRAMIRWAMLNSRTVRDSTPTLPSLVRGALLLIDDGLTRNPAPFRPLWRDRAANGRRPARPAHLLACPSSDLPISALHPLAG